MKIEGFEAGIFFIILQELRSIVGISLSTVSCGDICSAVPGTPYTLTCTWSGSLTSGITWQRGGVPVMTCNLVGGCIPATSGYATGSYPNSTSAILTITSLDSTTDSELWECRDGADPTVTCNLPSVATGNLQGQCTVNGNSHVISCSGITSHGTPAASLDLKDGSSFLASATSGGSVSSTQTGAAGKTYTCEVTGIAATCLSPTSVSVPCPGPTPACLCQCACTCEQASRIVLIIIIIVLVIVVAAIIAFIVVFCVKHIKTYNDHYRLVIFIVAIVVFIAAVACTIVVFVLAPPVEKPQVEGQDCCCSSCDSDGEKNKELCNDLKLSAAIISILVAVIMLIIITIILIVWFCPGKCGTDKLLNLCNKVPESSHGEAGPRGDNNSSGVGTPLNTVTPSSEKPKTKPVENSTGTSSNSGRQQSGNETTGKGTDVHMLQTNATTDSPTKQLPPIDTSKLSHLSPGRPLPPLTKSHDDASESSGKETLKDREENGTGPVTGKKKKKKKKGSKKGGKKLEKESTMPRVDSDGSAGLLD